MACMSLVIKQCLCQSVSHGLTLLEVSIVATLILHYLDLLFYIDQIFVHSIDLLLPFKWVDLCFQNALLLRFNRYFIQVKVSAGGVEEVDLRFLGPAEERSAGLSHQTSLTSDSALARPCQSEPTTRRQHGMSLYFNAVDDLVLALELLILTIVVTPFCAVLEVLVLW